ncbi:MAG: hypothetical protein JSW00_18520 [Thermoplasmata archaeon]|nr:MAG: hypothetical protein JSW00_18520 [Thermoplasmata archaeon]
MRKVRTFGTILGTLLIVTILLSDSAVADWTWVGDITYSIDCENPENALGEWDGNFATVGTNSPEPGPGDLMLDFGWGGISDFTYVWVIGTNLWGMEENYTINIFASDGETYCGPWNGNNDTYNHSFLTDDSGDDVWQYVQILGTTGQTDGTDTIYGPEIDAVGYEIP